MTPRKIGKQERIHLYIPVYTHMYIHIHMYICISVHRQYGGERMTPRKSGKQDTFIYTCMYAGYAAEGE